MIWNKFGMEWWNRDVNQLWSTFLVPQVVELSGWWLWDSDATSNSFNAASYTCVTGSVSTWSGGYRSIVLAFVPCVRRRPICALYRITKWTEILEIWPGIEKSPAQLLTQLPRHLQCICKQWQTRFKMQEFELCNPILQLFIPSSSVKRLQIGNLREF